MFKWAVYGADPRTGEPWRVTDADGFDAIPHFGAMLVYQPGTAERPVRNSTWLMYRADVGAWIGAEDDGSALRQHMMFPEIICTRAAWWGLDAPWTEVRDLMDADVAAAEG